ITSRLPEAMTITHNEIAAYVRRRTITAMAVGPGLTVRPSIRRVVKGLFRIPAALLMDAGALNNLKPRDFVRRPCVITPHPGELARFLSKRTQEIQRDRTKTAQDTARRLGVVCVLKGHHTVISDGERVLINTTGNQAMATGGMGDVLTG